MQELPVTKPVSYQPSPVPTKFKEPGYIIAEVPDRKHDSYKPSLVPPKYKEPDNIMPAVPDKKHGRVTLFNMLLSTSVSTEEDNYLPKVVTTPDLPITKSEKRIEIDIQTQRHQTRYTKSISDGPPPRIKIHLRPYVLMSLGFDQAKQYDIFYTPAVTNKLIPLPASTKISVTDGHPVATMASKEINPVPSKSKEFDYTKPEEPDRKFVSTDDDNYLPKLLTTSEFPITKPAEDDNYLPKVLTTSESPITKPASHKPRPIPTQLKQPDNIIPEVPDMKHDSYKASPVPPKYKQPDYIMPALPDKKHVSAMDDKYLPKVLTTPDLPITKSVSTEGDNYLPKDFNKPELPISKSVSTEDDNYLPKVLTTPELPITKSVSYEPSPVPSKFKEPGYIMPEVQDRKHVSTEDDNYLPKVLTTPELLLTKPVSTIDDKYLPKVLTTPDLPITKPVSYEPSPVPSKVKQPGYIITEVPDKKHVSTIDDKYLPKVLTTPDLPITKPVLEPITFSNELPIVDTKAKHHVSITETTISPLLLPKSAPKETHQVPTRPKTSSSPDTTPTKSSLNIKHDPSKPKNHPGEKTQQSKPEIIPFSQDFITTMVPVAPEKTKETLDPKETRLIPSKPKPSDKQERNKTKPASSKLNNKVTVTKTPRLRKVVHRTTPAPPKIRTPGRPSRTKKPRDEKLTNEDVTKPLPPSSSTKSSISVDSTVARKKPDPATLPGTPRPPLAPARPTPIRRRPLPPNNVTGKPGRSGNVLMPRASSFLTTSIAKPTWPSSLVKTNSPKKLPTAAASPNYNNPMFSSIPTTETDIAGTPRYTGDHVKYLKKEDDVPCSITDSMQHFSSDTEDNRDIATSPPKKPPTNLTVVTVEGCSSFVILDWKPPENETVTGYKVVSTENGGTVGKDTSIITTNQTHSTVENLKPNTR
ncbi:PREDICTED: target of Nesh-SH3-like [Thamnophis sirtalis]|uniref:Target of Nesh-SH3-like n=1 Tax=Thamnophis sirtalis TaxID=35019 RepID=A0A6I9YF83_9SAUR|nr:PREDICTED: target of Nesh-SH3-like [Thamnophis sirtalis]